MSDNDEVAQRLIAALAKDYADADGEILES
jgi:hypothetical protein